MRDMVTFSSDCNAVKECERSYYGEAKSTRSLSIWRSLDEEAPGDRLEDDRGRRMNHYLHAARLY